jgi:hypothetical protein
VLRTLPLTVAWGCGSTLSARSQYGRTPAAHAEARVVKKTDVGATVFVSRVRKDGSFGLAKPCPSCVSILQARGVEKCYYTIDDMEFGVLTL